MIMTFFRIIHETLGGHVHMRVFCGKTELCLGLAGKLCMTVEEFADFRIATVAQFIERKENVESS